MSWKTAWPSFARPWSVWRPTSSASSEQTQALEISAAQQAEAASQLQAKVAQHEDLQKRVDAERENLRERSLLLAQAEQARETLQEQLRRRSEELSVRHKALQEQAAKHEADAAANHKQREELESSAQGHRNELASHRQAVEQSAAELAQAAGGVDQPRRGAGPRTGQARRSDSAARGSKPRNSPSSGPSSMPTAAPPQEAAKKNQAELEAIRREVLALQQQLAGVGAAGRHGPGTADARPRTDARPPRRGPHLRRPMPG